LIYGVIELQPCIITEKSKSIKTDKTTNDVSVGVYKIYDSVEMPKYYTEKSACFDLSVYLGPEIVHVNVYNRMLMHVVKTVIRMADKNWIRGICLEPGECAFIPTGLIFNIPEQYKIAVYPRSGVSAKRHIKLANCVAVIDEDFTQQTMLPIFNDSEERQSIYHGDRLAQAEIVPVHRAVFEELSSPIHQKTDRTGGFGHTGVSV